MHPTYTTTYRVGNWAEYDRALVRRGDVTLWLTPDAIATWAAAGVGRWSGQLQSSDLAIETALTLSLIFHVPLRQTEGVLTSIFGMLGVDLTAPDHTTLSRRGQHLALALRRARLTPTAMNHVWAYDFVFDTCADGRRSLKCLTVVDEFTRECLAIDVAGSIRSGRVIDVLGQLVSLHGAPRYLRSDTGPEFIATALLRWLQTAEIDTAFIDPGKPWQHGTDESFNGQFRNECLSLEWFRNRMEAKIGIERWRRHDNEERPHMSLGYLTPAEFKKQMGTTHGWLGESLTGVIFQ